MCNKVEKNLQPGISKKMLKSLRVLIPSIDNYMIPKQYADEEHDVYKKSVAVLHDII